MYAPGDYHPHDPQRVRPIVGTLATQEPVPPTPPDVEYPRPYEVPRKY